MGHLNIAVNKMSHHRSVSWTSCSLIGNHGVLGSTSGHTMEILRKKKVSHGNHYHSSLLELRIKALLHQIYTYITTQITEIMKNFTLCHSAALEVSYTSAMTR